MTDKEQKIINDFIDRVCNHDNRLMIEVGDGEKYSVIKMMDLIAEIKKLALLLNTEEEPYRGPLQ